MRWAAEDDRADRQPRRLAVQIGNRERRLVGADAADLGVAREELDHVLAGKQGEAALVLTTRPTECYRGAIGNRLDIGRLTRIYSRIANIFAPNTRGRMTTAPPDLTR